MNCLETNMINTCQGKHDWKDRMTPTVKTRQWSKVYMVILEPGVDRTRKRASRIKRNCNNILFAFKNSLWQWTLGSKVSGFAIGNESIAIAHEEKCSVEIDPVESGYFCWYISFKEKHDEIIFDVEPSFELHLGKDTWLRGLAKLGTEGVIGIIELYISIFVIFQRVAFCSNILCLFWI